MLKILMKFVMTIISAIANVILSPIYLVLGELAPDLANVVTAITTYINIGIEHLSWILEFLGVPEGACVVFFGYILAKYTFWLTYRASKFAIKVYNYFKP